jgi:hypothetical protein
METWVPWIKIGFIALVALGLLWGCSRLKLSNRRHFALAFGAALSISLLIFSAFLAFEQSGPRNSKWIPSPDGTHVARIMIPSGSPVDSGLSSVIVSRSRTSKWQRAWSGPGWMAGGGEGSPYLHWADNSHLIIDYHQTTEPATCKSNVEDIIIECQAHNW